MPWYYWDTDQQSRHTCMLNLILGPVTHKTCRACKVEKPASEFNKLLRSKDGLQAYCRACHTLKMQAYQQTDAGKLAAKKQHESGYYRIGKGAIANMQRSSANRGQICTVTQEELASWWQAIPDTCHYCTTTTENYQAIRDMLLTYPGHNPEILRFGRFFRSPKHQAIQHLTIDRKDNTEGYTLDNIVKACWICNSLKNDFWTEAEMQRLAPPMMARLRMLLEEGYTH